MNIGERIRYARERYREVGGKKITQAELAKAVGLGQTAISAWEVDGVDPRRGEMPSIAEALHVSVNWLEFGCEDDYPDGPQGAADRAADWQPDTSANGAAGLPPMSIYAISNCLMVVVQAFGGDDVASKLAKDERSLMKMSIDTARIVNESKEIRTEAQALSRLRQLIEVFAAQVLISYDATIPENFDQKKGPVVEAAAALILAASLAAAPPHALEA